LPRGFAGQKGLRIGKELASRPDVKPHVLLGGKALFDTTMDLVGHPGRRELPGRIRLGENVDLQANAVTVHESFGFLSREVCGGNEHHPRIKKNKARLFHSMDITLKHRRGYYG
jgi:hypothetical protein